MKVFIDTSAYAALYYRGDQFHDTARRLWGHLEQRRAFLYTSHDVVAETIILLRRRCGPEAALIFGDDLLESRAVEIFRTSDGQDREAWRLFKKYRDKELSFVDCISFVLMHEEKLDYAFTFDRNFEQVGLRALKHPFPEGRET